MKTSCFPFAGDPGRNAEEYHLRLEGGILSVEHDGVLTLEAEWAQSGFRLGRWTPLCQAEGLRVYRAAIAALLAAGAVPPPVPSPPPVPPRAFIHGPGFPGRGPGWTAVLDREDGSRLSQPIDLDDFVEAIDPSIPRPRQWEWTCCRIEAVLPDGTPITGSFQPGAADLGAATLPPRFAAWRTEFLRVSAEGEARDDAARARGAKKEADEHAARNERERAAREGPWAAWVNWPRPPIPGPELPAPAGWEVLESAGEARAKQRGETIQEWIVTGGPVPWL